VKKQRADDIQTQTNASHNHHQLRIFDAYISISDGFPTMKGEDPRCKEMKRSIDCKKILRPNAKRRTPLKKAPSSWARCQPKERSCGELPFSET
jgi:hypothetical protein